MQREASQARRKYDHSAHKPGTPHLRGGPSRSDHTTSSRSLGALRKKPRIRGSPGSNTDSYRQRSAVDNDNEAAGSGPVGDRTGRREHGRYLHATAGAWERFIGRARGRDVDARVGVGPGVGLAEERQELATPRK